MKQYLSTGNVLIAFAVGLIGYTMYQSLPDFNLSADLLSPTAILFGAAVLLAAAAVYGAVNDKAPPTGAIWLSRGVKGALVIVAFLVLLLGSELTGKVGSEIRTDSQAIAERFINDEPLLSSGQAVETVPTAATPTVQPPAPESIYDSVVLPKCGGETDWVEVSDRTHYRLYWGYSDNIVVTQYLWNGRWLGSLNGLSQNEIGDIDSVRFCTDEFYYVGKEMEIVYDPIV